MDTKPPLDDTASLSLQTHSRSPKVCHSVPSRGTNSTPQPHQREPARGVQPHIGTDDEIIYSTVNKMIKLLDRFRMKTKKTKIVF